METYAKSERKHKSSKVVPSALDEITDFVPSLPNYVTDAEFARAFSKTQNTSAKEQLEKSMERHVSFTVEIEHIIWDDDAQSSDKSCEISLSQQDNDDGESCWSWVKIVGRCRGSNLRCSLF